jgi:acyl-CoA dehydrogenase
VKKLIPRISDTELIALRSGTTSIDRHIFQGEVKYPKPTIVKRKVVDEKIKELLNKYRNYQKIYPDAPYKEIFEYIGKNKFLSFIIQEKYGGVHLSVEELSSVLTKIASDNPALGIAIMVPNSLGPAELLQVYGTKEQQDYYLPGLANGKYIPCFGLTGPNNGSDATGAIDEGELKLDNFGRKIVEVSINKRYITLAPVANLIGLAIRVKDPNGILKSNNNAQEGVTVFLIKKGYPGLEQNTHHNPLDVGFPNGTLKGKLTLHLDDVIGGEDKVGHGWKMLMECLAAGRGICLPATAKASANSATTGIIEYASHRKQFKMPILNMEGVQTKIADMLYHTWLINTSVALTNTLLDMGEKPAVISAIMKQQTTDRAREVLNHAMDIHAGSAICLGENNFLAKFYKAAPIGITVEGSNTLTKSLIIFGQGLNKSHPHISNVLECILKEDIENFNKEFTLVLIHSLSCYLNSLATSLKIKSFLTPTQKIEQQTVHFSNLANFIALKGGSIKGEQMLSGDMADLLSNLYLGHSVIWYHKNHKVSKTMTNYCLDRLYQENQRIINRVIDNQVSLRPFLFFMKSGETYNNYRQTKEVVDEYSKNKFIRDVFLKDIVVENNAIGRLFDLGGIWKDTQYYNEKYADMIDVEEFPNPEYNDISNEEYQLAGKVSRGETSIKYPGTLILDR